MDATTTTTTTTQPLADRSTNTHLALNGDKTGDLKGSSVEKTQSETQSQGAYVSPSDGIMSPCTKKLSDLKGKRFRSAGKPQSLFAKLGKKNFEQSSLAANNNNKDSPMA